MKKVFDFPPTISLKLAKVVCEEYHEMNVTTTATVDKHGVLFGKSRVTLRKKIHGRCLS